MKPRFSHLLASFVATSSVGILNAAIYNWNGSTSGGATGSSNTWNTIAANWTGDGTVWPASGADNDAVFGGTAGTVTIATAVTANDLTFNTTGYIVSGGTLTLASNGTTNPVITNAVTAEISSIVAGSALINKAGAGTLVLSGTNSFTGGLTSTGGVVRISNSSGLGTGGKTITARNNSARIELNGVNGSINLPSGIVFNTSGVALRNIAGNNTIAGRVDMGNGSGNTTIGSNGGTLTLTGLMRSSNSGNRALDLTGTSTLQNTVAGTIQNNASIISLVKSGVGKWIVSGSNTFTGTTTVSGGNLTVTSPTGLGSGTNVPVTNPTGGDVAVSAAATLHYAPLGDGALAIGGNLAVAGNATIGCPIGTSPTGTTINVAGNAIISDAPHTIDLFGVPGTTAAGGTYTLVSATGGSSALAPTTPPTLGKVFNNTSFSVGAFTRSANTLQVDITALTPLNTAYWVGGLAGSPKVWAVSNGSTSNWAATSTGSAQALVPGSAADVIIAGDTPTDSAVGTVLGADMTVNSLTIADPTDGLGLNDDGYTLKLLSGGLSTTSGAATSSIAAKIALDGDQTWTLDSANPLSVSGIVSGASALTKAGTGTLVLAGSNTHSGVTRITAGTLSLANANALAGTTLLRDVTDAGTLTYTAPATTTYNLGGLTGDGTLDAGGNTLNIGGNNQSTTFSGSIGNGALAKSGTGNLTLTGASDFAGAVTINAGRLTLSNSAALGTGPKTVSMLGTTRSLYLANGITLPAGINLALATNSGDGTGLHSESGSNTILGNIEFTFGNPGLNISSAVDSTLSIAGNLTMTATGRTLYLGGASTGDNTISGAISESTSAVMPVVKQGVGKWILSGTNTYKGNTTVSDGTLVLANGGSTRFLPAADGSSNKLTGTGSVTLDGALAIDLANATTATSWLLVEVATLGETYGDNFTVTGFTETPAASGVWKRTVGSNTYTFTEATGLLSRETATNTYANWLAANPPATGFDTDSDQDGVPNGIENVLGTNPNASTPGLTQIAAGPSSVTYQHTLNPTIAGDISYSYEWSTDLVQWLASGATNSGGTTATIAPGSPVGGTVTVTTTATAGPATKLFTRIKATQP